ncbi:MAG: carbohydrate kinase family protein [Acidimicrobiales bacterium]
MAPELVLVVGECLVDLAPDDASRPPAGSRRYSALPGGGPANAAVGLARLGVGTGFAGRFAVEGFGPWLREHLSSNGVDLSFSVEATEPATLAVVVLDGAGRASYTFYGPETADWQWSAGELPAVPGRFGAVHTGSLVATFEPGASVLAAWLESVRSAGEAVVSLDPNVRRGLISDPSAYRERLERLTSCAHIVKASDEDLAAVYPGEEVEAVAGAWLSGGAALVVVTEGECGATAFHASGERSGWAPPEVEVADTIGAGDAFSAALLARFASEGALSPAGIFDLGKDDLDLALRQAVAASAFTCTRPGADPPTLGELNEFLRFAPPTLR